MFTVHCTHPSPAYWKSFCEAPLLPVKSTFIYRAASPGRLLFFPWTKRSFREPTYSITCKLRQSLPLHPGAIFSCRCLPDMSTSLPLPLEWKQIWTMGDKNRLLWHQIMTLRCWSLPLKKRKHAYSVFLSSRALGNPNDPFLCAPMNIGLTIVLYVVVE